MSVKRYRLSYRHGVIVDDGSDNYLADASQPMVLASDYDTIDRLNSDLTQAATLAVQERDALRQQAEAMRADAERYRWLREPQEHCAVEFEDENEDGFTNVFYALVRDELDAAIDAALAKPSPPSTAGVV
jgi:hypothetical protein